MIECPKTETLFKHFIDATNNHLEAAQALANVLGSRERFPQARLRASDTYAECQAAQSALKAYCEHHNCGTFSLETANPQTVTRGKSISQR